MRATTPLPELTGKLEAKRRARIVRRHQGLLGAGEIVQCTIAAVAPESPQPRPGLNSGLRSMAGHVLALVRDRSRAQERAHTVRRRLGSQYSHFPKSLSGYQIAVTDRRVLVFDGRARQLLQALTTDGLRVAAIDHGSAVTSLVFDNGVERYAVTAQRGGTRSVNALVDRFAASYLSSSAAVPAEELTIMQATSTTARQLVGATA